MLASARLTPVFSQRTVYCGRLHSVFEHAVNIAFEMPDGSRRLITCTAAEESLPDGIVCGSKELCRIKENKGVFHLHDAFLSADGWALSLTRLPPLTLPSLKRQELVRLGAVVWATVKPVIRLSAEQRVRISLTRAVRCLLDNNLRNAEEAALGFIGLGAGLTPSADDALVGAMAVCASVGALCPFLSENLLARTTTVSAKYLQCAQEGFFSGRLAELFLQKDHVSIARAALNAACWGASSGQDMLWGLVLAIEVITQGNTEME